MRQHACERTSQLAVGSPPERSRVSGAAHTSEHSKGEVVGTCVASMMLLLLEPHRRTMPMASCARPRPQPRARSAR